MTSVLTVEVVQYIDKVIKADGSKVMLDPKLFKISRETMMERSPYFKALLVSPSWQENPRAIIPLDGSHVLAMDIHFKVLHKGTPTFTISVSDVWPAAPAVQRCQTDARHFENWFVTWYTTQASSIVELNPRTLVDPCWRFDVVKAFLGMKRSLVYNGVGHLTEKHLANFFEHHLIPHILRKSESTVSGLLFVVNYEEQLNAAKADSRSSCLMDSLDQLRDLTEQRAHTGKRQNMYTIVNPTISKSGR